MSFVSAILSHAAGTFVCTVSDETEVSTSVDLVTGQEAFLTGSDSSVWQYQGADGAAFIIGAQATLVVNHLSLMASSGLAFRIDAGAELVTAAVRLQAGGSDSTPISCTLKQDE